MIAASYDNNKTNPSTAECDPMFCPMKLDCRTMTGVIYQCPNVSECLRHSRLSKMEALLLYFLNQGVEPEDIKIDGQPLQVSDLLNQST